jgi:large subunit ribosomal protein L13
MKTQFTKKEQVKRMWHLVDCEGQTLGRLSTRVAKLLMGKHKSAYTPNTDMGDYVVVVNSDKIKLTGNKLLAKMYYRHSNYPGGFREERAEVLLARDSRKVIEHAVRGMIPGNKLQTPRLRRMKVYKTSEHPHAAQLAKED